MPVVARLNRYGTIQTRFEFDETTNNNIGVGSTGYFTASEFVENVGLGTNSLNASKFKAYDFISDEFVGNFCGPGEGTYMRHNEDKTLIIYDEIDEVSGISSDGYYGSKLLYPMVFGTKTPVLGSTGASTFPATNWTSLYSGGSQDVNSTFVNISPLRITIDNLETFSTYFSPNSYITLSTNSTTAVISPSSPSLNTIFIGGADNSMQRLSYRIYGTDYYRVRFEGTAAATGTAGSPNIVFEITFFNKLITGGRQFIEILVGTHARASTANTLIGIKNPTQYYVQQLFTQANQSYVLSGNSNGTEWQMYTGAYMSNTLY